MRNPAGNWSRRDPSAQPWGRLSLRVPSARGQRVPKSPGEARGWLKPYSLLGDFWRAKGRGLLSSRAIPRLCLCLPCWSISPEPPGNRGAGETLLPSSLFPKTLFQPTLTHFALLPSMAWGRKQHLDLIKRLPSPKKRPKSNLCYLVSNLCYLVSNFCYLVSPSPVDRGGSSSSGLAAGLKGSRMLQQSWGTGSLKMGPAG